jgi:cytochrome P450
LTRHSGFELSYIYWISYRNRGAKLNQDATASISFDPFEPSWRDCPLETFQRLRDRAPVYRSPSGQWVLSRYADVRAALADAAAFSSDCIDSEVHGLLRPSSESDDATVDALLEATFHGLPVTRADLDSVRTVISSDGAEHVRQRKLIDRAFSPARVRALQPKIDAISASCAEKAATASTFDVMADLADVLPRRVIGELLGVEAEYQPELTRWVHEMMGSAGGAARNSASSRDRLISALREFASFFVPRIEARREAPGDDFISDLVRAESDDRLTPLETLLLIRLLVKAGTDTTGALISHAILELMRDSQQLDALQADPSQVPAFLEETLRFWAPFYFVLRETTRDVTFDGITIPAGSVVALILGSANHDESAFECPAEFDPGRRLRHMSFGHGAHFCVGSHLARAEAVSAVGAILPHLHRFAVEPGYKLELAEAQVLQRYRRIPLVARTLPGQ